MTLEEAYASVALDPLILRPWEVARLTDYQIEHWYRLPAARRAAQMPPVGGSASSALGGSADPDLGEAARQSIAAGQPPSRMVMVSMFTAFAGMSDEEANAEYDRQLALHHAGRK